MSLLRNIAATYRGPGQVARRLLDPAPREDRTLVMMMGSCATIFVAQWPQLSRQAFETGQELDMLMTNTLFGLLFLLPLALYGLAALAHLVAKPLGGQGSFAAARAVLSWALVAAMPAYLLWGLTAGFVGPGAAKDLTGLVFLALFLWFWSMGMRVAEFGRQSEGQA
ncbi:YIP1 family protein [Pseudooceanicola aestuarii]|uniref:YIP1 family protein n=1 Tax=Pseudooceanicola aestuarii TaxID=2697319 RepID=UPI0013D0AC48|nr:YIP1 family protein [Pseudooceanicola aestuarii]